MENIEVYLPVVVAGVGFFVALARITPNKSDDKIADFLLKIINIAGVNPKGLADGKKNDT